MRDLKSIFLLFLLFIGSFSVSNASELLHVCRILPPPLQYASNCDPYGGITYFGGPGCDREILMRVYLSNLTGYDNYPISGGPYPIPSSLPKLYILLDSDFNDTYSTKIGPIDYFTWNGLEQPGADGGTHYIFQHDINLAEYLFIGNPCSNPNSPYLNSTLDIKIKLVQEEENGSLILFDVEPYADPEGSVSCEVFHEACVFCVDDNGDQINATCSLEKTMYEMPMCFDCTTPCNDLQYGSIENNELKSDLLEKSNSKSKVTPNPFQDEVIVQFDVLEKSPTQIEIIDLSGAVVFNKNLSSNIGNRKETISLDGLPKGVYFLKLTANNSNKITKIVKL